MSEIDFEDINAEPFYKWKNLDWEKTSNPFKVKIQKEEVCFFLKKKYINMEKINQAYEIYNKIDKCKECEKRIHNLMRLVTQNGKPAFLPRKKSLYPSILHKLWDIIHSDILITDFQLEVIANETIYPLSSGIEQSTNLPYLHFNIWSAEHTPVKKHIKVTTESAFRKYFPLMQNLFQMIGNKGIEESLHKAIQLCDATYPNGKHKIPYADKIKWSFQWLLKYISDDFNQKNKWDQIIIIIEAIFDGHLTPNNVQETDPIHINFHQMNDTGLKILAHSKNEEDFINIMSIMFSPNNYCRPQAIPTDGQIQNGIELLGDFKISLMTLKEANETFNAIPFQNDSSSLTHFENMKISSKEKKSKFETVSNFASKCKKITTLNEVLALSPNVNLEINVQDMSPCSAFTTTLGDKLRTPHLWHFLNYESPSYYKLSGFVKVLAILPMDKISSNKYRNYLFICEGAKIPKPLKNCCFSSLLNTNIQRHCRTAFEKLNETMEPNIPDDDGPFAMGVGASVSGSDGKFINTINLKINNEQVYIDFLDHF